MEALPAAGSQEASPPRSRGRLRILAVLATALILLITAGAAAGFLIGRGSGPDLAAARDTGAERGLDRGKATGGDAYAEGQAKGWRLTYGGPYRQAYREAYAKTFKRADMKPPEQAKIVVNVP